MATADTTNSFITVSDADTYFDGRLHATAWTGVADSEDKDRALIQASRMLNQYVKWIETEDVDAPVVAPTFLASDDAVKWAACELALILLQEDTQVKDVMEGIAQVGMSGLTIQASGKSKKVIPDHIFKIISHLGRLRGSGSSVEIVRA